MLGAIVLILTSFGEFSVTAGIAPVMLGAATLTEIVPTFTGVKVTAGAPGTTGTLMLGRSTCGDSGVVTSGTFIVGIIVNCAVLSYTDVFTVHAFPSPSPVLVSVIHPVVPPRRLDRPRKLLKTALSISCIVSFLSPYFHSLL